MRSSASIVLQASRLREHRSVGRAGGTPAPQKRLPFILALAISAAVGCGSAPAPSTRPTADFPGKVVPSKVTPDPRSAPERASDIDPARYLRPSSCGVIHVDVPKLLAIPWVKNTRRETLRGISLEGSRDLGEILTLAERVQSVTFILGLSEPKMYFPGAGVLVLHTQEDRDDLVRLSSHEEPKKFEGASYFRCSDSADDTTCLLPMGERTVYVGSEAGVREIISAEGAVKNPKLAGMLRRMMSKGQIAGVLDVEPGREDLVGLLEFFNMPSQTVVVEGDQDTPRTVWKDFGGLPILELPEWTKSLSFSLDLADGNLIDLSIESVDEESAGHWALFLNGLAGNGTRAVVTAQPRVDRLPAGHPSKALNALVRRLVKLKVEPSGAKVAVTLVRPAELDQLPAILDGLQAEFEKSEALKAEQKKKPE